MSKNKKFNYIITFDIWNTLLKNISYKKQRIQILTEYIKRQGYSIDIYIVTQAYNSLNYYLQEHRQKNIFMTLENRIIYITEKELKIVLSKEQIHEIIQIFQYPALEAPPSLVDNANKIIDTLSKYAYLGLISDTGFTISSTLELILKRHGIPVDAFQFKNYSENIGYNKPNEAMFHNIVFNKFNIPTDCITHIGDNYETDIKGAILNNINSIYLCNDKTKENCQNIKGRQHYSVGSLSDAENIFKKRIGVGKLGRYDK